MSVTVEHSTRIHIRRDAIRRMRMSSPSGDPDEFSNLDLELQTNVLLSAADEAYLIEVPASLAIRASDNTMTERDWNTAAGVAYKLPLPAHYLSLMNQLSRIISFTTLSTRCIFIEK